MSGVPATQPLGDPGAARTRDRPDAEAGVERAVPYLPRILQQHLVDHPDERTWSQEGTAALLDISGFTTLSERLARKGREGAEQIADAIAERFESILQVAYDAGGSLLKFGGDALLLWFQDEGHTLRACRAAVRMRRVLRSIGRIEVPGAKVTLRMAQGVHTGSFHFFAVGQSHVELLPVGPAWTRAVLLERAAGAGEILVGPEVAALLPARCLGSVRSPGQLLLREPPGHAKRLPLIARPKMSAESVLHCLPRAIRAHIEAGGGASEHRPVTIAFLRFEGTDALMARDSPAAVAAALHRLLSVVQAATEKHDVAFLGSDVDADGGKLILTAGAPRVMGDDEERMLLALRDIVEADLPLPIHIGVHRGSVFAGDIGPFYRRTYTVMGDAVNVAARLMAAAGPGEIYASSDVLDHSDTLFEAAELAPLAVKGRTSAVRAWSVGKARGSRTRNAVQAGLPLVGRGPQLAMLRDVVAAAQVGRGALVEIVGEGGVGKTRMLEALREECDAFRKHHAVCEAYTATTPYAVWRELLRELLGIAREESDAVVAERLRELVAARADDLLPWLPLLAIPFDIELPATPEVALLAETNRRAKLHEVVGAFLAIALPGAQLIEIDDAHQMDRASAELLAHLAGGLAERPWIVGVARRPSTSGFAAPTGSSVTRVELGSLAPRDATRLAQLATEQHPLPIHVLDVIAQRSGGNPQFLRDLARSAMASGGIVDLPASAEAAAIARIDALVPGDRALVRRAAVLGLTFHPRMLSWFDDADVPAVVAPTALAGLQDLFAEEPDGYLRFRHSLLRDAAYEGLPYRVRRQLHGAVAARIAQTGDRDEAADILSMHCFVAGDHASAWRYATVAGRRAVAVYAYVEAARLYARALEAGRRLHGVEARELAEVQEALGDAWHRAGDFHKAATAFRAARRLVKGDRLKEAGLLLKHSWVDEKFGNCPQALRWVARALKVLDGVDGREAARQTAQLTAWYATVLLAEGRPGEALRWAQRAVAQGEALDDPDALGAACFALGWACSDLGNESAEPHWMRSLEAYRRSGNRVRQAGLLSNLGVACEAEGRWDEALEHYARAREESLKIGNTIDAELARINIAEILGNRGEVPEAEALLEESLPIWRSLGYRYFLGACLFLLGRVAARAGRFRDALDRFETARTEFHEAGSPPDVLGVDARIAECRAFTRDGDGALELADRTLGRTEASNTKLVALLERVRGQALLQKGDVAGARAALEASLAAGRKRPDLFEVALTLLAQIELARAEGTEVPAGITTESRAILERLRVLGTPPQPPLAP